MHAHVRNPKQRVELQQKPQLESSRCRAGGSQFSSESREAGLCLALHPAPLATQLVFGGESFARTVRHEHRRLGAMPRLVAWMDRAARPPVNAAASSSTAAFGALPQLCEAYAASAD